MDLERPSPQLMGEFNSNDAARAHALDSSCERPILVDRVMFKLFAFIFTSHQVFSTSAMYGSQYQYHPSSYSTCI